MRTFSSSNERRSTCFVNILAPLPVEKNWTNYKLFQKIEIFVGLNQVLKFSVGVMGLVTSVFDIFLRIFSSPSAS